MHLLSLFMRGKTVYINDDMGVRGYESDLIIEGKARKAPEVLDSMLNKQIITVFSNIK